MDDKPCPFCSSTDLFVRRWIPQDGYAVNCELCDATGPISKSEKGARRFWNMRALLNVARDEAGLQQSQAVAESVTNGDQRKGEGGNQ